MIQPRFKNDRILAQTGMFTVHRDNTTPIEQLCSKPVERIELTPIAIVGAKELLEIASIDVRSPHCEGMPRWWRILDSTREDIGQNRIERSRFNARREGIAESNSEIALCDELLDLLAGHRPCSGHLIPKPGSLSVARASGRNLLPSPMRRLLAVLAFSVRRQPSRKYVAQNSVIS